MACIVLLGDSIFDNAAYVGGGPDVITHLRGRLPAGWSSELCAEDGATASGVCAQRARIPAGATHLVVSAGGNDALGRINILGAGARSMADALHQWAAIRDAFEDTYRAMLAGVLSEGLPTVACTIYNPRLPDAALQRAAVTALAVFNDVILRAAFSAGVPMLDLRAVCDDDGDFANPIEPSVQGGARIAGAILRAVMEHRFEDRRTSVFLR